MKEEGSRLAYCLHLSVVVGMGWEKGAKTAEKQKKR
jgi:hypothetical protein